MSESETHAQARLAAGQQPDFAWIPERKGLSKLFMGAKKREDVARGRSLRVFVFPQGINWINGNEESSARWEEITAVFHKVVRHTTNGAHSFTEYYFTLKLADGRTRVFGGLLGVRKVQASEAVRLHATPGVTTPVTIEQLGRLLEDGVTRTQLPKAIDRFNAGQAISFGRLTVSPAGIAAGDQSLTWGEIQEVRTRQGIVSVKKAGKWLMWKTVRVSDIPNYSVFDALVRAILAQRGAPGAA